MLNSEFQKSNQLSIYSGNCLRNISPMAQCSTCEQICPEQALSFSNDKWTATNCSLCGLCSAICPTQVFQIDQHRVIQHAKQQPISLCCTQNTIAAADALRVNCLQQFSPLSLIYLLYHHPQLTIYLSPEQCQSCRHNWYTQGLIQQLAQYKLPEDKLRIVMQKPKQQTAPTNQRRDLFRDLFHRTETQSKKAVVHAVEQLTASFTSSEAEAEQTEIFPIRLPLYALYVKNQLPVHADAELPFRQLECTSCNFCSACTHVCPTQALTLQQTEQEDGEISEKQLVFQQELCINCNLCQNICMQHGLQWEDFLTQQQFLQTPVTLAHSNEKICTECEHSFFQWPEAEESICSFCKR